MKKTIKPSPVMLMLFGIVLVVTAFVMIVDVKTGGTPEMKEILVCIGSALGLIFYLAECILRGKVHFDEDTFTVRGKTYNFSQISDAVIGSTSIFFVRYKFGSTQKIKIYVKGDYVFSFNKDDPGSEDFIAMLKKHRIKFTVKNSLSDWKGEIK